MVQLGFNAQDYDIPTGGEPVPQGWYACSIAKVELKPTKDGQGQILEFTHAIDANHHPEQAGRLLWDRLNVFNKNEKTQNIARGILRKLQECVGKPTTQDTDELIGCELLVKATLRPATEQYRATNEVRDYKPIAAAAEVLGSAAPVATAAAAAAPATPAAPAQAPAWARK